MQPYSIIKIEDEEAKKKLAELNENQSFIADAPVNLLFCIDWHRLERWAELEGAPFTAKSSFRHFWISFQDTIICAQNICTAADSMGLGYPKSPFKQRRKLGIEAVVHDEKYQELEDDRLLELFEEKYPGVKYSASPENMEKIRKVCTYVGGEEIAEKCLKKIKEQVYINQVQRYFGLHYAASEMPLQNEEFLRIMEEFGFKWFKKYVPFSEE